MAENGTLVSPSRGERVFLVAAVVAVLAWSGIAPNDRLTWILEVAWVVAGVPLVWAAWSRFPLTRLRRLIAAGRAQADERNFLAARGNLLAQERRGLSARGNDEAGGGHQQSAAHALHLWNSSRKLDAREALQ